MPDSSSDAPGLTRRQELVEILGNGSYTLHELAPLLGMKLTEVEHHLHHLARTARNEPWRLEVEPAQCRQCDFRFGTDRFRKPGKCPRCRSRRIDAPRIGIVGPL